VSRRRRVRDRRLVADINMIPLIDVALVLLVIFMVITPALVRSQIEVQVPEATTVEEVERDKQVIEVEIERTGQVWIQHVQVPAADIEKTLAQLSQGSAERSLWIAADREVDFQHVVDVMDAARKTGIEGLAVSVRRRP
jgi:biopolymer transport protein ExbD